MSGRRAKGLVFSHPVSSAAAAAIMSTPQVCRIGLWGLREREE